MNGNCNNQIEKNVSTNKRSNINMQQFYTILFSFIFIAGLKAQISMQPVPDFVDTVAYTTAKEIKDPYFVYYATKAVELKKATVQHPTSGTGDFTWYQYNTNSSSFDILKKDEKSVSNSALDSIDLGGYLLNIKDTNGLDTSIRFWCGKNDWNIFLDHEFRSCESLILRGDIYNKETIPNNVRQNTSLFNKKLGRLAIYDTLYYYDIQSGAKLFLDNQFTAVWTSSPTYLMPEGNRLVWDIKRYVDDKTPFIPAENTSYTLEVTDKFGLKKSEQTLFESTVAIPKFSMESDQASFDASKPKGEAPLKIRFINESKNGVKYLWTFSDSVISINPPIKDTSMLIEDTVEYTFFLPRRYKIRLVAAESLCKPDTFNFFEFKAPDGEYSIEVYPSSIASKSPEQAEDNPQIPNVFINNGFNRFHFEITSLKEFRIVIFSKFGKKVYEYDGSVNLDWPGWDGKIQGTDVLAGQGVYYFIIEATGWTMKGSEFIRIKDSQSSKNQKKSDGRVYTGMLYVFDPDKIE